MPDAATLQVTLHIFSGRPDPTWLLSEAQVADLKTKLGAFPSAEHKAAPGLGYRGVRVTNTGKVPAIPDRIIAYRGVLTVTEAGKTSYRVDVNCIEEWLLNQARSLGYAKIIDEASRYGSK